MLLFTRGVAALAASGTYPWTYLHGDDSRGPHKGKYLKNNMITKRFRDVTRIGIKIIYNYI